MKKKKKKKKRERVRGSERPERKKGIDVTRNQQLMNEPMN